MQLFWIEQAGGCVPTRTVWLSPAELSRASALQIPKRRADWLLGRWTAKSAVISYLGLSSRLEDFAAVEIRPAISGAPEVFWHGNAIPVEISLSHRNGTAVCAIGPRNASFGCDVELVENRDSVFVTDYFTPEEQEAVRQVPDRDQSRVITVIWSTKESALKALRTGLRLDTRSIAVQMNDSLISCGFNNGNTSEWTSVAASGPEREIFVGWFRLDGELVKTLLSAMPVSCPTPLFPITVDRSVEQRHPPQRLRWDKLPVNSFAARKEV